MKATITADLPHLREGGEWKKNETKKRAEYYIGLLKRLGMPDGDAQCLLSDMYWDCFTELSAAGRINER